jgi:2-polyprenyl-3-methyl-5-hydroxy-6-metoxy-1,4-benzoquinol methylase
VVGLDGEFDYQWKNLPSKAIEYTDDKVREFLKVTGLKKSLLGKCAAIKDKKCFDIGCGNGRYTFAMLRLGAAQVDSIDVSSEAIAKCKSINPNAKILSIFDLDPNPAYDFVLSWGVLNHISKPREGFAKLASQVSRKGMLHIMVYHRETQYPYVEGRQLWRSYTQEQKIQYCRDMIAKNGWGDMHGWFDALNPEYNWSWHEDEVRNWFEEEGFNDIKLITRHNINMQGIKG